MPQCNHNMKPGIALIPILGHLAPRKVERGDTVHAVGGTFQKVSKCSECGYTVFLGNLPIRSDSPSVST